MPDYSTPNKRKRYIESEFRCLKELVEKVTGKGEAALLHGAYGVRRCKAILSVYDRAEAEFGKLCSEPVLEALVRAEIRPLITYNAVNQNDDLTIGAALWILGTMRKTERFREMTEMLPDLTGDESFCLPLDFSHPCFSNNLIQAVMYVLKHKHLEVEQSWKGEESDTSTELASEAAARGEKAEETFTKLMDMLPQEEVKRACGKFRKLQWDLLSRYIKSDAWMSREIERMEGTISSRISGLDGSVMAGSAARRMPGGLTRENVETLRLADEGEKLQNVKSSFPTRFSNYIQMERRKIVRETGSRIMADELSGFTIDDPYEICFAIYALIESGEDLPWLMSSGSYLCEAALHLLPWYVDNSDGDAFDDWDNALTYDVNGWLDDEPPEEEIDFYHTKHQGRTLAQIVYDLSRGVVPVGQHPLEKNRIELIREGMDERVARKVIDMAEMFFLREFQADTYKAFESFAWEEEPETQEAEEKTAAQPIPGGYWGRMLGIAATEEKEQETVGEETAEKPETDHSEELEKAKQEIKALRDALYKERRAADDDRAKAEHELKTLRLEHRELADLRELVFNRENENQERLEKTKRQISYPYQTKKRTVVFGGHDSFLRAFKPMLPTVRFVDAGNLAFSPEIIRNADVVWIQNNCISHSQYWSIVKNCKQAGVQMRYFAFASAEKCAEQLVEWDEK